MRALECDGAGQSRITQFEVLEPQIGAQRAEAERDDQRVKHQVGAAGDSEPVRHHRGVVGPQHGVHAGQDEQHETDLDPGLRLGAATGPQQVDHQREDRGDQQALNPVHRGILPRRNPSTMMLTPLSKGCPLAEEYSV